MNIREFREITDAALREEGFEQQRIAPRRLKVWSIPGQDLVRFFAPHAHRRPWGFAYYGFVGIEIPALREWLDRHKPGDEAGIFHTSFVAYHIANEKWVREFMVTHDDPVPTDLWAGMLMDRLLEIPASLDDLVTVYCSHREKLGWLAGAFLKPAWDFLLKWREDPDPTLHVPRMLPNGRIV